MYISDELQESCDYLNRIIDYGNSHGWDVHEPIDTWVKRYEERLN